MICERNGTRLCSYECHSEFSQLYASLFKQYAITHKHTELPRRYSYATGAVRCNV